MYQTTGIGIASSAAYQSQDAKPAPRLDGPAAHLEEMTKGLTEYSVRLARVADRLLGSTPEPVEKEGGGMVRASCVASRYESIADTYASILRKLGNVVERLESV